MGADRRTGEDRVLAVNALTEEEAAEQATVQGLLVESVREAPKARPSAFMSERPSRPACPVCGVAVAPVRERRTSTGLAVLLFLFGGFPGILYLILYKGYQLVCPRCGAIRAKSV